MHPKFPRADQSASTNEGISLWVSTFCWLSGLQLKNWKTSAFSSLKVSPHLFWQSPGGMSYVLRMSFPCSSVSSLLLATAHIYFLTTIHRLLLPGSVSSVQYAHPHLWMNEFSQPPNGTGINTRFTDTETEALRLKDMDLKWHYSDSLINWFNKLLLKGNSPLSVVPAHALFLGAVR